MAFDCTLRRVGGTETHKFHDINFAYDRGKEAHLNHSQVLHTGDRVTKIVK